MARKRSNSTVEPHKPYLPVYAAVETNWEEMKTIKLLKDTAIQFERLSSVESAESVDSILPTPHFRYYLYTAHFHNDDNLLKYTQNITKKWFNKEKPSSPIVPYQPNYLVDFLVRKDTQRSIEHTLIEYPTEKKIEEVRKLYARSQHLLKQKDIEVIAEYDLGVLHNTAYFLNKCYENPVFSKEMDLKDAIVEQDLLDSMPGLDQLYRPNWDANT